MFICLTLSSMNHAKQRKITTNQTFYGVYFIYGAFPEGKPYNEDI